MLSILAINHSIIFLLPDEPCGPYGHDIHLREICAAWKQPPVTEMTREEYESWLRVEKEVCQISLNQCHKKFHKF